MSKDPTANLMDKAVSDIVSRSMEGKLDPLTQAEKDAAILKETEAAAQSAGQVVRHGAKALAGQGIGGTGYDAAGSMASLKSDTERNRQAALSAARVGIQTGAMREGRLAREAAGRLGTQLASARASSAQPFTLAESKARFGTNFPNV
jgi:hypothetical protein